MIEHYFVMHAAEMLKEAAWEPDAVGYNPDTGKWIEYRSDPKAPGGYREISFGERKFKQLSPTNQRHLLRDKDMQLNPPRLEKRHIGALMGLPAGVIAGAALSNRSPLPLLAGVAGGPVAGYHIGKLLEKKSEAEQRRIPSAQKVIAQGLLGLGSGMLAGYGIGKGIQHFAPGSTAVNLAPRVAGTAGAIMGVTYPWWKTEEREAITRALEARRKRLEKERSKAK